MVNCAPRLRWAFAGVMLLSVFLSHAKDLSAYRLGDRAEEDIAASVPLDVIDDAATASRREAEMAKTPAIFREFSDSTTNALATGFSRAFNVNRASFLSAAQKTLNLSAANGDNSAAQAFEKFTADFNQNSKTFPVGAELAQLWISGDAGSAVFNRYLNVLLLAAHRPIRADNLPAGFATGEALRLVTVDDLDEKLSLADADNRGQLITASGLATLAQVRAGFRRSFSEDQQNLARALQVFLQPNCAPESELTQQARERAVSRLFVVVHYDVGQSIVRRGETVDAKALGALAQLDEKLTPQRLNQQLAAERERVQQQQLQAQQAREKAQQADLKAQQERDKAFAAQSQTLEFHERNLWLAGTLATVSLLAVGVIFFIWRRSRRVAPPRLVRVENENSAVIAANLAPQLTQALKDAVVQGLAAQRKELLQVQQLATAEIGDLVRRLDELQAPMQERVRAYEQRINELEKELTVRTEENRELLKLKIEMMRQQLELERSQGPRFN